MRSLFSLVPILFTGLIGCSNQANRIPDHGTVAARTTVAANAPDPKADPAQICPDICGDGTLCALPNGSCGEVCNSCYCTREGGTVVDACPKAGAAAPAAPGALESLAQAVATPDGTRSQ